MMSTERIYVNKRLANFDALNLRLLYRLVVIWLIGVFIVKVAHVGSTDIGLHGLHELAFRFRQIGHSLRK